MMVKTSDLKHGEPGEIKIENARMGNLKSISKQFQECSLHAIIKRLLKVRILHMS